VAQFLSSVKDTRGAILAGVLPEERMESKLDAKQRWFPA